MKYLLAYFILCILAVFILNINKRMLKIKWYANFMIFFFLKKIKRQIIKQTNSMFYQQKLELFIDILTKEKYWFNKTNKINHIDSWFCKKILLWQSK